MGLYVEQLDSISEADFSFKIEAFVDLVWCDPRLAYDADAFGESRMIFLEDVAHNKLNGIWWPDLEIVNAADPPQIQQEELIIFPDFPALLAAVRLCDGGDDVVTLLV